MNDKIVNNNHEVKMIDRCILNITGIKKIINFDNKEFIIESVMGPIHIKGENMELLNLDTTNGVIKIKGKVNSYVYLEKTNTSNIRINSNISIQIAANSSDVADAIGLTADKIKAGENLKIQKIGYKI